MQEVWHSLWKNSWAPKILWKRNFPPWCKTLSSFNWGQISIRQKALWTNDAVFPWKSRPELTSCQVFIIFFPCRILFIFMRTYGQPHPQRVLNRGLHITTSPIISLLAISHALVGNVFNIYQWSSSINVYQHFMYTLQHFMYTLHHVNWALIKDIWQLA